MTANVTGLSKKGVAYHASCNVFFPERYKK